MPDHARLTITAQSTEHLDQSLASRVELVVSRCLLDDRAPVVLKHGEVAQQIEEHIGSGPYVFKRDEFKPGDKAVYTKFAKYVPRSEPPSVTTGGKRVYVDRVGTYNFQFSAQLNKSGGGSGNVFIWYRVNGVDAANSATSVTLAGSSSAAVAAWNFVIDLNAGDYFELVWSTSNTNCVIEAAAASAPVPAIPSVILTVTDNIN
jgi:hypothetical protein